MTTTALRLAGAALLAIFAILAGAWVRSIHHAAPAARGIPVPAGQASAPNPSDLAHSSDLAQSSDLASQVKIPDTLPQFSLGDRTGKATSIQTFAGKSLIINFWATWCAPCQREIPLLQALQSEWAPQGVTVVGVAVDFRDKVLEFADRFKIRYPLLIGEQDALDAAAALGVDSPVFPFTVFTDRHGQVVALYIGELHRPQADLILSQVTKLNQNLTNLADARRAIAQELSAR